MPLLQVPLQQSVQALTTVSFMGTQVAQNVVVRSQTSLPAQSVSAAQLVLHAVPLAQMRLFGQAPAVPAVQPPAPLQLPAGVSVLPEHEAADPHEVVLEGYTQAPPLPQLVAPQVPVVVQAAVQQLPVPVVPQTPEVHWSAAVHAPVASLATQVPLAPGLRQ